MRRKFLLVALTAVLAASLAAGLHSTDTPERRYIGARSGEAPLPFSDAVLVGDTLYVGGHLGLDPETGQAPADLEEEIRLLLDEMQGTLEKAGMTMDDLVNVTVYCTDLALYDEFNRVYRMYYKGEFPARAFIGAATLLRGTHFELQGIAVKRHP